MLGYDDDSSLTAYYRLVFCDINVPSRFSTCVSFLWCCVASAAASWYVACSMTAPWNEFFYRNCNSVFAAVCMKVPAICRLTCIRPDTIAGWKAQGWPSNLAVAVVWCLFFFWRFCWWIHGRRRCSLINCFSRKEVLRLCYAELRSRDCIPQQLISLIVISLRSAPFKLQRLQRRLQL